MERLTERYIPNDEKNGISGIKVFESDDKIPLVKILSGEYLYPAIEKLATYEDLEEQGLLVRLPYNNGTLYSVNYSNKTIAENTIIEIAINGHAKRFSCLDDNLRERKFYDYMIGENVFLTREEAEKKLEVMKKNATQH